jgi:helix-turn-helix protein
MVSNAKKELIRETLANFDTFQDVYVTREEGPDCLVSFTTSFGRDTAYDVELTEEESGYKVVLLTSSENPLMQEKIGAIDEEQVDSLFDHVIETLRELEGN